MSALTREETEALIKEVLEVYPEKAQKDRAKHLAVNDQSDRTIEEVHHLQPQVAARRDDHPRLRLRRFQGRGVGSDQGHDPHLPRPVGCGQYSRAGRRNYYVGTTGVNTFGTMNFTSDFQEKDIVFGGDKKLAKLIGEIEGLFPLHKGISVQSECPIGLIGDDIEAVSKKAAAELDKPVVPVRCEGFRGVSQSLGHHIANDAIRDWVFSPRRQGRQAGIRSRPLRRVHHRRLQHRRRRLVFPHPARRNGPARGGPVVRRRHPGRDRADPEGEAQPAPLLPLDELHRPPHGREVRHPLDGVQLLRPDQDRRKLRAIAAHFDDKIKAGAEAVIAKYQPMVDAMIAKYKPRLEGKRVMLYVGGLRPRHVIGSYEDLGMEVVGTGYEFATTTTTTAPSRRWATRRCCTTTSPASSSRSS
jgi:nitrogenase molybdenum-iron protein alpha chain